MTSTSTFFELITLFSLIFSSYFMESSSNLLRFESDILTIVGGFLSKSSLLDIGRGGERGRGGGRDVERGSVVVEIGTRGGGGGVKGMVLKVGGDALLISALTSAPSIEEEEEEAVVDVEAEGVEEVEEGMVEDEDDDEEVVKKASTFSVFSILIV